MPRGVFCLPLLMLLPPAGAPAAPPGEAEVARLIKQLGSDVFAEREAASRELAKAGEAALGALEWAARSDDAEVRRRARELVARLHRKLYGEQRQFRAPDKVWRVAVAPDGKTVLA